MRRIILIGRIFWIPILLLVAAAVCWFYVSISIDNFRGGLLGTALGVGITIFAADSFKKLDEYKRIKKTFGLLKLVAIVVLGLCPKWGKIRYRLAYYL